MKTTFFHHVEWLVQCCSVTLLIILDILNMGVTSDLRTWSDHITADVYCLISHLCSWAATCTESMMSRKASEICLALTVCCSNFVFTADWEMHSYNHTNQWFWKCQKFSIEMLFSSVRCYQVPTSKRLSKFWNSNIRAWKPSASAPPALQ